MNDLIKPVDEIVQNFSLQQLFSKQERELLSLPVQSESLGIPLFSEKKTCNELEDTLTITASQVALIITQSTSLPNTDKTKEATKIITEKRPNN